MSTATQQSDSADNTTETVENETVETAETADNTAGEQATETVEAEETKPDPAKQSLLADLHKERGERKTAQSRVAELETQVTELTAAKETLDAVQAKYDRLEAFIAAAGGNLARVLDSRAFTQALFETDKDVTEIVAEWNKANPSATSQALRGGATEPGKTGPTMNDLLRSAAR